MLLEGLPAHGQRALEEHVVADRPLAVADVVLLHADPFGGGEAVEERDLVEVVPVVHGERAALHDLDAFRAFDQDDLPRAGPRRVPDVLVAQDGEGSRLVPLLGLELEDRAGSRALRPLLLDDDRLLRLDLDRALALEQTHVVLGPVDDLERALLGQLRAVAGDAPADTLYPLRRLSATPVGPVELLLVRGIILVRIPALEGQSERVRVDAVVEEEAHLVDFLPLDDEEDHIRVEEAGAVLPHDLPASVHQVVGVLLRGHTDRPEHNRLPLVPLQEVVRLAGREGLLELGLDGQGLVVALAGGLVRSHLDLHASRIVRVPILLPSPGWGWQSIHSLAAPHIAGRLMSKFYQELPLSR